MTRRRVVVTGFGVMSACGKGWSPYWNAAVHGQSAIREVEHLKLNGSSLKYAGFIADFDPKQFVTNRKSLKVMSEIQLAVAGSSRSRTRNFWIRLTINRGLALCWGPELLIMTLMRLERVSRARLTVPAVFQWRNLVRTGLAPLPPVVS